MTRAAYDLAVVGAGAGGLTAAAAAAALGAKTALIEARRFGGDCTWTGCVPSKALLRAAGAAADARSAHRFGIDATVRVDGARVLARVRAVRERIYAEADAPEVIARYGIEALVGRARFLDAHTLEIAGDAPRRVTARRFVLATGSRPRRLDLGVATLDTESIWDIPALPERLLIVGGGPVAVESAQAFGRLGVRVTIVTAGPRILERDEPEAAAVVARALQRDDVRVVVGRAVASASACGGATVVTLSDGEGIEADRVLVAVGRDACVEDLGLERAGVALRAGRIAVDGRSRTSARHVYAVGDCASSARFTHVAERMAAIAVMNAIVGIPARFDPASIAWTTFTDPELAQVGPTQAELGRVGRAFVVHRFPLARLDRAIVDDAEEGFVSILAARGGRVLAGTVVGPRAGEAIAEIALARERGLSVRALAATLHAYPTYAMGVRRAADGALVRARTAPVLRALRVLRGLRGIAPPADVLLP